MEKYELQRLRDLPIEGVAERLGLRVERHKCLCPFHEDKRPSLTFRNNKFKCWACGESGDTISLAMKLLPLRGGREGSSFVEACRWLGGGSLNFLSSPSSLSSLSSLSTLNNQKPPFDAARYARYFEHPYLSSEARRFLFEERKLDERVVRWCRLTSWRDRKGVPWLQIPYYNREGKLVGVQNRNLGDPPPFLRRKLPNCSATNGQLPPGGSDCKPPLGEVWRGSDSPRFRFPAGSKCGIYNLPVLNLLRPGEDLYITEGCSDCWAMLSAGHKAIAIPSATLLTHEVINQLLTMNYELSTSLHMYPDRDAPGERLFLQLQKVLPTLQHHQLPPDCKDFSEYYLKEKQTPSISPVRGRTWSGEAAAMSPPPDGQLPVGSGAIGERMRRRAKVRGGL